MGKITVTKNRMPEIVQVCKVRKAFSLSCRLCDFHGESCDSFKSNYKLDVPADWEQENESEVNS